MAAPRSEVRTVTGLSVSLLMQVTVSLRRPPKWDNYDRGIGCDEVGADGREAGGPCTRAPDRRSSNL
ncbi:hypothetical protein Sme01_13880 [Sphaerisporangium melleum]|uniref:Uncharacterized protein n=1 Tax=Sphaerisporangium melleum TaxID=321316 RepID=A0A917VF73_9ACTN|nr:hypothetical protein GCM10007964_09480 [Sphaerisporangium melleum]GII68912.1 hypothetical protein Sme01_13880 [Sphaerisporangium melleum]